MRTQYQAIILLRTEEMWFDPKEKCYIGYDPDTSRDFGVVTTFTADTLKALKEELLAFMEDQDLNVFENQVEWSCAGEHSYNTPKEEQIPFGEFYTAHIEKIQTEPVDQDTLEQVFNAKEKS